ncbi:SMI1/KNR4 family protein [Streptomyces sp. NPDC088732]|uniref:SMI1/KNR4 family protein n=1 Tax=Streptomyces sp. NPDC088732 TaxID=3365879 RepID=UPI00381720A1
MSGDMWAGVRDRVLRLGELPDSESVFGARGHGFRLGPVMEEEQLQALEEAVGVDLPTQYRGFLLQVGAGGAGPDYGLVTPVLDDSGWQWRGVGLVHPGQSTTAELAGRPFVVEALQRELDALVAQEPKAEAYATDDAFHQAFTAWDTRYEELYDAQEAGVVFLSEQGCGYSSLLVMTGPHAGAVWDDVRPADGGIVPTGHDFGQWYLRWLVRTEQHLDGTSAVHGTHNRG